MDKREMQRRYANAMHGIQTAILFEIEHVGLNNAEASPKHLRTGINSAMVNDHAVAKLLVAKGIFTEQEYAVAVMEAAEEELASMTERVRNSTGFKDVVFE